MNNEVISPMFHGGSMEHMNHHHMNHHIDNHHHHFHHLIFSFFERPFGER